MEGEASRKAVPPASFTSPEPDVNAAKRPRHTLSGGDRKKHPQGAKRRTLVSTLALARTKAIREKEETSVLQDVSNIPSSGKPPLGKLPRGKKPRSVPTRKLEFMTTPQKSTDEEEETSSVVSKKRKVMLSSSSSSSESSSESSEEEVEYSSTVSTIAGNSNVIVNEEGDLQELRFKFRQSSTVSSIAISPKGDFLIVGFVDGHIYLYPLTLPNCEKFANGVVLDHISAKTLYTQLMVHVAVPDDGKFIFAGVYRGSNEIRAFEVDSIQFPSNSSSFGTTTPHSTTDEKDHSDHYMAHAIRHSHSDAKLKGFAAVKSIMDKSSGKTKEYRLLSGLGIKNVHVWRFFQTSDAKWNWECIFDKQTNGNSLEVITFHPTVDDRIVSKSRDQNIRVWTLEDGDGNELAKKSHRDVKQSVNASCVYGDVAYGGDESLTLVDLRSSYQTELDLPLSPTEQLQVPSSQRYKSMRSRRMNGRQEDGNAQRLMRVVSQVASHEQASFCVGLCTDGSVFAHFPTESLGLSTPLQFMDGYDRFFHDKMRKQQFSDLTRVNATGYLTIVPQSQSMKHGFSKAEPKSFIQDDDKWFVVAANQGQVLVRSLNAFREGIKTPVKRVKKSRVKKQKREKIETPIKPPTVTERKKYIESPIVSDTSSPDTPKPRLPKEVIEEKSAVVKSLQYPTAETDEVEAMELEEVASPIATDEPVEETVKTPSLEAREETEECKEQVEPVAQCTFTGVEGENSLLEASMFQYATTDDEVEATSQGSSVDDSEAELMMKFALESRQLERNFAYARDREVLKKESCMAQGGWKKKMVVTERRMKEKDELLRHMDEKFVEQRQDMQTRQRMEADAFRARQMLDMYYAQLRTPASALERVELPF